MIKIILIIFLSITLWAEIGHIMAVKGEAKLKRTGALFKAISAMELLVGDEIITYKKSRVQVMLKDDTVVTIGSDSSFVFDEFSYDGTENSKILMKANRGFFRSVTGKIGKIAPERFKVKTASATIGIRGTDFSGDISIDKEVFKCYSGEIYVEFEGAIHNIEAGKVMSLIAKISTAKQKIKDKNIESKYIKKDLMDKKTPPSSDINKVKDFFEFEIDNIEIKIEDIADIIIEEKISEVKTLEITPGTQDR